MSLKDWVPLVVSLVTLIGGAAVSRNWPTLGRRVRDHTALVKDLPEGLGVELRALLADELTELTRRDRRRLDPLLNRYSNALRGTAVVTASLAAFFVPAVTVILLDESPDGPAEGAGSRFLAAAIVAAVVLAVAALVVLLRWASGRRFRRVAKDLDAAQEHAEDALREAARAATLQSREVIKRYNQRAAANNARRAGGLPPLEDHLYAPRSPLPPPPPLPRYRVAGKRRPPVPLRSPSRGD